MKEAVKRLAAKNLTVNTDKAKFFCNEISFLGNVIKNNWVTIEQDRTINVRNFPRPRTNCKTGYANPGDDRILTFTNMKVVT